MRLWLQNLHKALEDCCEYHERLQVVAEQAISFDLDDGIIVNYAKFGDILEKIKYVKKCNTNMKSVNKEIGYGKNTILKVFEEWYKVPSYQRLYFGDCDDVNDLQNVFVDNCKEHSNEDYFLGSYIIQHKIGDITDDGCIINKWEAIEKKPSAISARRERLL